jgi:chorismate-pyruvate lyase
MSHTEMCINFKDEFTPIERILLTANGNLQRILSAFFNSTVSVKIIYNNQIDFNEFDRKVHLQVHDQVCNSLTI